MFAAKFTPLFIDENFHHRAKEFWDYFLLNRDFFEQCIDNKNLSFLKEFEIKLKSVFINYQKDVFFCFKKNDSRYIFEFYFYRNSYLLTLVDSLFEEKPKNLTKWIFLAKKNNK